MCVELHYSNAISVISRMIITVIMREITIKTMS